MLKRDTVILVGGESLTSAGNIQALEKAGYQVISAHTLDHALVANELFAPRAVVLDAGRMEGDIDFFCQTLALRPNHPSLFLVGVSEKQIVDKTPLTAGVKILRSPLPPAELAAWIRKSP